MREIGIPKTAPKAIQKKDEAIDKRLGIKEGSKADLKKDRALMKEYEKKNKK